MALEEADRGGGVFRHALQQVCSPQPKVICRAPVPKIYPWAEAKSRAPTPCCRYSLSTHSRGMEALWTRAQPISSPWPYSANTRAFSGQSRCQKVSWDTGYWGKHRLYSLYKSEYRGSIGLSLLQKGIPRRAFPKVTCILADYFTMLAISSAKLSSLFSRPSPFSKRVNAAILMLPPSSLATCSVYCFTLMLLSCT